MSEIDKQLNPREIIERRRKEFEAKYGDKLQKRMER
jgi:ATP synthase F1 complex assembly factor 1